MELTIKLNLDNSAFGEAEGDVIECAEIRAILTRLVKRNFADSVRLGEGPRRIMDSNGNSVGTWELAV